MGVAYNIKRGFGVRLPVSETSFIIIGRLAIKPMMLGQTQFWKFIQNTKKTAVIQS